MGLVWGRGRWLLNDHVKHSPPSPSITHPALLPSPSALRSTLPFHPPPPPSFTPTLTRLQRRQAQTHTRRHTCVYINMDSIALDEVWREASLSFCPQQTGLRRHGATNIPADEQSQAAPPGACVISAAARPLLEAARHRGLVTQPLEPPPDARDKVRKGQRQVQAPNSPERLCV